MARTIETVAEDLRTPSPTAILRKRIFGHYGLVFGVVVLAIIVALALFAPLLTPHDPYAQDLLARMKPPFWMPGADPNHLLGTDFLGRDYLARLLYGARISLAIGLFAALISGLIGTAMGVAAGYFGGRVDLVVTFLINVRLAMPVVLVALAVVAILGGSLQVVVCVLGLLLWDRFAVVMRSVTMQVRAQEYVVAAKAIGCSTPRIILTEILPNVAAPLTVIATIEMATAILYEASLSFLGLGVQPPLPSWGLMLAEAKEEIFFAPWMITMPGIALFILLMSVNLLGDGIRDLAAPGVR